MPPKPRKPPKPTTPPTPTTTVTPPAPVAGPTPSPTSTTATTMAVENTLKGGKHPIDKTGGQGFRMPKGLTKDQQQRKMGKQKYYWKDRAGKWHYHVSGKTDTDRNVPNPVDKGKQQKKASESFLKDRLAKAMKNKGTPKGAVKTGVVSHNVPKPSPIRGVRHPVKHAERVANEKPRDPGFTKPGKPQLRTGVSVKTYDDAKRNMLKSRRRNR